MDVYSNVDTQVPKDARSSDESSVNDLANDLTKSLNIQGEPKLVSDSIKPFDVSGFKKEDKDMCEEPNQTQMTIVTSEKFLIKSSTFPSSSKIAISDGEIKEKGAANGVVLEPKGHAKSVTPPCQRSISLPAPSNLKSAMKGSREKNGIQPNNLTVTWAPGVYDPTPTAVSHVVTTNKNQTRSKRKNGGKNKQKGGGNGSGAAAGKPSRGARGKEKKKQARKYGGTTSNECLKSLDEDDWVVDNDPNGQRTDLGDFNVGSPDPHCGSSFLKKSVTKMHFSLTEAT